MNSKKIYRSTQDKKLLGVAGGLAEYFEIDSSLIRIGFALLSIMGGSGLLIYLIMGIVIPTKENM